MIPLCPDIRIWTASNTHSSPERDSCRTRCSALGAARATRRLPDAFVRRDFSLILSISRYDPGEPADFVIWR